MRSAFAEAAAALGTQVSLRMLRNAANMPELMAWADAAVSRSGHDVFGKCRSWSAGSVGGSGGNQLPVAQRLDELGVAHHIGSSQDCSSAKVAAELTRLLASVETRRNDVAVADENLVDGRGASRVCDALLGRGLRMRRARESDCRLLWEWANEPGVRASAFSQRAIGWEDIRAGFMESWQMKVA